MATSHPVRVVAMTWDGKGVDPWLPERLAALAEVVQAEQDIRRAFWAELSGWLVETGRAVLRGDGRPSPDAVWARVPAWREAVDLVLNGEILKAVGIAFRRIFGTGYAWDQRTFVTRYLAEVRNRLVRVPEEVFDLIAHEVAVGVNLGEGIPELRARVDKVLSTTGSERWANRATTVARTEAIGALNAGRTEAFKALADEDPDTDYERVWLATEDHRTRPTHRVADGQRVPLGSPFSVGGFDLMFPGDPSGPPQEIINCVIGSTQVEWPRQLIQGATRRRHIGPFVQVTTAEGHDLTVTPNHPVLTPTGYVPAGLLRPGQYVLATGKPPLPEVDHVPTSAEEVHRALCQAGQSQRVRGSRMDFHGDGTNDEVEVVGAYGYLPPRRDGKRFQQVFDIDLVGLSDRETPLSGLGGTVVARVPVPGAPDGVTTPSLVRRPGQGAPLLRSEADHTKSVGVTSAPNFQTQLIEAPEDGRTADSDFPAHLQYALAIGMAPTEIVQVNRYTGTHDVYNLSTSDHWYTGNGIALHNCRCVSLLVEQGETIDLSNRQFKRR